MNPDFRLHHATLKDANGETRSITVLHPRRYRAHFEAVLPPVAKAKPGAAQTRAELEHWLASRGREPEAEHVTGSVELVATTLHELHERFDALGAAELGLEREPLHRHFSKLEDLGFAEEARP